MSTPGQRYEHRVVVVRATGRVPAEVAADIETELPGHGPSWEGASREGAGWEYVASEPFIFNSSASGYLLFFLRRPVG
jgi:hypothetical protein